MRLILIGAAALLLAAACGGDDGSGGGGEGGSGGSGGTGHHQDGLCATYHPHPQTQPELEVTTCVPEGWPLDRICWRTTDTPDCYDGDGTDVAVGCYLLRDRDSGIPAGTQTVGCRLPGDCIAAGIDNPECCGAPENDGLGAWDCPTQ